MFVPLSPAFYKPSAAVVAPRLLGHWLLRRMPSGWAGGVIVETEAYLSDDPACHGASGRTERNRPMWEAFGRAYVYFIYGCHFCVNAVCQPPGIAEAVLVRAIEPTFGMDWMRLNRPVEERHLTNGPAKLCAALQIGRAQNAIDLCSAESEVMIACNPDAETFRAIHGPLVAARRIGISKAMERPLRFFLRGSKSVSRS
jgi:DNA-3-methyladenine glycosylase